MGLLLWVPFACAQEAGQVIALKPDNGTLAGQDARTFTAPVTINDTEAQFVWGCSGWTFINESLANKLKLKVVPNKDVEGFVDPDGKPMYLGECEADVAFGGKKTRMDLIVMRESKYNKQVAGIIGYEVAKQFQWELNPAKCTLTLRPLKTGPAKEPLALLELKDESDNLSIPATLRGHETRLDLLPQTTDVQAGPELQTAWKLAQKPADVKVYPDGHTVLLTAEDALVLGTVKETRIVATLVGDPNDVGADLVHSSVGSSVLNRFVYCVDVELKQFRIMERVPQKAPPTRPVGKPK